MSMISELIERLRAQKHNLYMKTSDGKPTYPLKLMLQAADVIEELSAKLQEPILDKIRAEVEQITDTMGARSNQYVREIDVLKIIDKYKAESEDKE